MGIPFKYPRKKCTGVGAKFDAKPDTTMADNLNLT